MFDFGMHLYLEQPAVVSQACFGGDDLVRFRKYEYYKWIISSFMIDII